MARKIVNISKMPDLAVSDRKVTANPVLERFSDNPILEPVPTHPWESKAVFNPGAINIGGKVHIIYRALGDADISFLGYASSIDGLHIDERLDKPIYSPREPFEGSLSTGATTRTPTVTIVSTEEADEIVVSEYTSGGGGSGRCEDPRLSVINSKIYMTYVAYDGHSPPRVALTSINVDDFLARDWQWKQPVLISPPGVVDKNACILPEKINSKYVIFHRIYPDILIDFVDDLEFDGKTRWLKGEYKIPPREDYWDSRKLGAGAPPIRTKDGWLLIYQAVGERDPSQYLIGAMLLDLKDPTRVLARSDVPILEPQAKYENEGWKSGVVYPCGAVVIKDRLFVYYGGADKFVCGASVKLDEFLGRLAGVRKETLVAPGAPLTTAARIPLVTKDKPKPPSAYCFKCHTKREMKEPIATTLKNGRPAIQGRCKKCGTRMFCIVKA